jgi:hypothetical protein
MTTVTKYFSANNIEIWAEETLSQEELSQFNQAYANNLVYFQSQKDNGKYVIEEVYETFASTFLNTDIDIHVGERYVFAEGSSLETDCGPIPEYNIWIQRYWQETGGDYLIKD